MGLLGPFPFHACKKVSGPIAKREPVTQTRRPAVTGPLGASSHRISSHLLGLILCASPSGAQFLRLGVGPLHGARAYVGPGDIVSGAVQFYGV